MSFLRKGRYTGTLAERDAFAARDSDFWVVTDGNRGTFVYDGNDWIGAGGNLLNRIPNDVNVKLNLPLDWIGATELPNLNDLSGNNNDMDTISGTVSFGMVGNLTGVRFGNLSSDNITGPTGQSDLVLVANTTLEMLLQWDGAASSSALAVEFGGGAETEATNIIWSAGRASGGATGIQWFHEFGAGSNESAQMTKAIPPKAQPFLFTAVRDDTAKTVSIYYSGNLAEVSSYTNSATGGSSGFVKISGGAVTDITMAGFSVSDIRRDATNILLRARQVGVA